MYIHTNIQNMDNKEKENKLIKIRIVSVYCQPACIS